MLFNSLVFLFAFLPVTYVVFWLLRTARTRYVWLAITGYVFYGFWDPSFCLLMAFSTLVSYVAGLGFLKWDDDPARRRLCLILPITVDLALLGFFKYANFLTGTVAQVGGAMGLAIAPPVLNVVLPVGISFYTFHTISYIVDAYRRVIVPTRNLFEFSAYVSLFSQLVAGPIVRFRQIEEDLENIEHADRRRWLNRGVFLLVYGMFEKVVIADSLARFVDPALLHYETLSSGAAWLVAVGYTLQLYFDFCGYSDMAVGLGYMFGLRIPWNFNSPYKALDPSDFWRRWHISLSSCLRDYVYIPLGGNRGGATAVYRNLMLTMLIGGLWHGANWTFVAWGGYHGLLLMAHRMTGGGWDRLPAAVRQAGMFLLALFGWVLFRSTSFEMARHWLTKLFVPTAGTGIENLPVFATVLAVALLWSTVGPNAIELDERFVWRRRYAYALAAVFGVCLAVIINGRNSPFLYFQF
jgi:alginate O-acetyltransferase complex protein AlgI